MTAVHTYFVSGRVYVRAYGAASAFEFPGLVDQLELGISENVIALPDRTQPGGGNYAQVRRIESMTMTMNLREFKPSMISRALFGTTAHVAGASIEDEEHVATNGGFIPLNNPGPYTAVTVTMDDTGETAVTADNYEIRPGGIFIKEDAPDLEDDDEILVNYTHPAYDRVQALTGTAPELEIFFEGLNEADSNNPRPARLHRVRLGPASALALLSGDDFGALQLQGEVLRDTTKSGEGVSQYFTFDVVTDLP